MRWLLDPEDRRLGQPSRGRKVKGNKRPAAFDETVVVLRDSPERLIDVMANDVDPEGGALTLVSAGAALGAASVSPDGLVSYTPPPGFLGSDSILYEVADPEDQRDTAQVNVSIVDASLQVDVTLDERIEIETGGAPVDVQVTLPTELAGTYLVDPFRLQSGPDPLSAPTIIGTIADGETLTVDPGLWAVDTDAAPASRTWQWQAGGDDISGATGNTLQIGAGQASLGIGLLETLSDSNGSRTIAAGGQVTGFVPSDDTGLIGWWDASDAAGISETSGVVTAIASTIGGNDLVAPDSGRRPTTGQASLNGLNVVTFADDYMNADVTLPTSGTFALHIACTIDAVFNPFAAPISFDAASDFQLSALSDSAFLGQLALVGIGTSFDLTGGPYSGPSILSIVFDLAGSGMASVFINDVLVGSGAISAPASETGTIRLFTNRPRSAFVHGNFGELIVSENITNRSDFHGYLSSKWGIS